MGYNVERISEKNFDSFIEIFEATFSKKADRAYFQNKFNTAYTSSSYVGFIAFEDVTHAPAAFYGVYPTQVMQHGKLVLAAQSGDTATHPNHRKKGLFNILHDHTMELCKQENIAFVFGFPNAQSYPGFLKFGWTHTSDSQHSVWLNKISFFKKLHRKLSPDSFESAKIKLLKSTKIELSQLSQLEASPAVLSALKDSVYIPRTPNYLAYKEKLGSFVIQLNSGYAWVSPKSNELRVGELFCTDADKLFAELMELCLQCGFDLLSFTSSHHDFFARFEKKFPVYKKQSSGALIINHLNGIVSLEDANFVYSGGDFDTF
mgnify:CR=1 FL=1